MLAGLLPEHTLVGMNAQLMDLHAPSDPHGFGHILTKQQVKQNSVYEYASYARDVSKQATNFGAAAMRTTPHRTAQTETGGSDRMVQQIWQ